MLTRVSTLRIVLQFIAMAVMATAADPAWRSKAPAAWTEEDARQILADSPWSAEVAAKISPLQTEDERREGGNMGQEHGIGFDGIADDRPRVQAPKSLVDMVKPEAPVAPATQSLKLQLRWESALPVRVAEMKSRDTGIPGVAADSYCLAVYGVPYARFKGGDPKRLGEPFIKQAVLKREGKKDVKPSSVEVFAGQDGLVIVYLFPLSAEISRNDRRIEFDAQIGRIYIAQSFDLEQMQFKDKLEL